MLNKLGDLQVFSGRGHQELTKTICQVLDKDVGKAKTELFPDNELIVKIQEDVRGRDCYVVISTCEPVNDNLMELFIFADTLLRASAGRITAVIPYFGYARQDRKAKGRTPITAKLCANLLERAGYNRVITLDLHSAQIQGFFDIPVDHLAAAKVFFEHFEKIRDQMQDLVIVSPDVGNAKVAQNFADALDADIAIIDKRRINGSETTISNIIGNVKNKHVLMMDDMISTAGTMCDAAHFVMEEGANDVWIAATHPVFAGSAISNLMKSPISKIFVTNTIPQKTVQSLSLEGRLHTLEIGPLLASAIKHIHNNESVSALFKGCASSKR